jgi:type IV pilus assembly protein PilB
MNDRIVEQKQCQLHTLGLTSSLFFSMNLRATSTRFLPRYSASATLFSPMALGMAVSKMVKKRQGGHMELSQADAFARNFNWGRMGAEPVRQTVRSEVDDAPVVRFLQGLLHEAVQRGASDLHLEPLEHLLRVRMRIDGELHEVAQAPGLIKDKLASRIKVISALDIAEKRLPQDGRMRWTVKAGHEVDLRISTLPTLFGEKVVIRILEGTHSHVSLQALGYEDDDIALLTQAIARPYGMILVTGPTGSGKTLSLYSLLHLLNQPGVNIATAEDPSEIVMPGINQVNVNDKTGLTFATALRAFLRQDPDIIMVGEVRDLETAEIALKAAQTGHLVLSTLHTNDAPATLTRLRHMGVAPFNTASSVMLITAQRLARRLCALCKAPETLPASSLRAAGVPEHLCQAGVTLYRPVGCAACHCGYKGRVGLFQVMPVNEAQQHLIIEQASDLDIAAQARRDGVRTLREAGWCKVQQGLTSVAEVLAVTKA